MKNYFIHNKCLLNCRSVNIGKMAYLVPPEGEPHPPATTNETIPAPIAYDDLPHALARMNVLALKHNIEGERKMDMAELERNKFRQEAVDLLARSNGTLNQYPETPANHDARAKVLASMERLKPQQDRSYEFELRATQAKSFTEREEMNGYAVLAVKMLMANMDTLRNDLAALQGVTRTPDPRGTVEERQKRFENRQLCVLVLKRANAPQFAKRFAPTVAQLEQVLNQFYQAELELEKNKGGDSEKEVLRAKLESFSMALGQQVDALQKEIEKAITPPEAAPGNSATT